MMRTGDKQLLAGTQMQVALRLIGAPNYMHLSRIWSRFRALSTCFPPDATLTNISRVLCAVVSCGLVACKESRSP